MSRLIDADALVKGFDLCIDTADDTTSVLIATTFKRIVNKQPTVTPERKRGRWKQDENLRAVCSECGEPCATYVLGAPKDKYCKWCGAKMEEGD